MKNILVEVFKKIEDVLSGQKKAFKLALSLGYRLIDRTTGEERYFAPGSNSYVFSALIQINDKADIQSRVMDRLNSADFKEKINFPASAYQLEEITAFHLAIHPLNHRLGDEKVLIPQAITNNRNIINYPKTENKCVFHCIAGFLNADKDYRRLQGPVKELFKQYCTFKETEYTLPYFKSFEGVDMMDFHELEDCYQLNINVFEMDIDNEAISIVRETKKSYERTMNILDYKGHAMLIKNIAKFEGRHICDRCKQIFTTQKKLSDHKRTMCDKKVLESFVSGPTVYEPPQNKIETMLRKYGIKDIDHYLSHFIVYDFEALMTVIESVKDKEDKKTKKTNIHKPMSVSIFSSIFETPKCFISEDSRQLLTDMFDYIYSIQEKVYTYNAKKYAKLFYAIGDYTKDKDTLNNILNQVPVLGFNSGRYDINLIKKDLFSVIGTRDINMVIKNPSYMCIATNRSKMLDICNYIAAGTSYEKYLKAFGVVCQCEDKIKCVCSSGKGSFCYEYITDFSKLNETELPPQEAFYSNLRKKHLSDEEYERLKFGWSHYEMKTLKDLLIWYNNLDVVPFVEAVKRQREFYKSYKLDMLADGVSLPSLAEKIMYQISFREMKPIEFKHGKPFKKLIGSYFGKQILIYTPLLKWYLDHGMVITKTYSFIKASKARPFKQFTEEVSSARREGDKSEDLKVVGESMKTVGNSAFGRSGMDKTKHKEIRYVDNDESYDKIAMKPTFYDSDELNGAYEMTINKRRIKMNNPIHLSIAIYQLAKLRMLQFYYDFIDFYFNRSDFQYIEMDTDSAYIAFSAENPFEQLIKPELRNHFIENRDKWLPRDAHIKYDSKTPGLFKEEWRGDGIYALSPKNYICFNPDESYGIKISAKGVQGGKDYGSNKRNSDILNPESFGKVIKDKVSLQATNKGFRIDKDSQCIITYEQVKCGLSYFYDKRKVLANGIDTEPLDL